MKRVYTYIRDWLNNSSIFFIIVLMSEIVFSFISTKMFSLELFINIFISSMILSQIISMISYILKGISKKIFILISLLLVGVAFALQVVFYNIFKVYFSIYNLELSDQVGSFMSMAIKLILNNIIYIIMFLSPFIISIYLIIKNRIKDNRTNYRTIIIFVISILLWIGIYNFNINFKGNNSSTYDLYHNINNISLNIKKLGVINSYYLEITRKNSGFTPDKIEDVDLTEESIITEEKDLGDNKLELDFIKSDNNEINIISDYISSKEATKKNEYTGIFEGYNLIYIVAESFSEIGISKELTPTLYRLTNTGFTFKNFYTPYNLSTIGGEFQALTGLYPDYSILRKWRDGTNYFPYGLGTVFKEQGYNTFAYHNNAYNFQDRNKYLLSQGFDNYLGCYNGLEKRINCNIWPQSDDEMIEKTIDDYINSDKPFMTYYMTVSGHFGYEFYNNSMANKNKDLVSSLDKGTHAKAYVATQIELDRALERLLNELDKHDKLDNTVIVLMADHYPYELDEDSINSLSTYKRDEIEVNHNALILWNNKLENKIIDKPCMSVDVLPTVYNLFGIDYDSRLFSGSDILSNSFGIAILDDTSWITNKGKYIAYSKEFNGNTKVDDDYIYNVNKLVNNRINIDKMIMKNDYYRYLFNK